MAKKPIGEAALVDGLILARENESKFVDAATESYKAALVEQMARARAMAMMGGSFCATIAMATHFDFEPGRGGARVVCSGQVTSTAQSEHASRVR